MYTGSPFIFHFTILALFLISGFAIFRARKLVKHKKDIRFPYNESDTIWDLDVILYLGMISILGGLLSTIVGVTSYWLYFEAMDTRGKTLVEAKVTSICLVMLGSFVTSIQYITAGNTNSEYIELFIFLCMIAAMLGLMLRR